VEVHQVNNASSDIVMGLEAIALLPEITPVSFGQQPVSVTVAEGGSATFSVVASGYAIQYQWYGPGGAITGATNATLTINPALRTAAGSYHCEIQNVVSGPLSSSTVMLTIIEDHTAPKVAWAFGTNANVVVEFSEPTTGGDVAGNYTVTGSDSSTISVTAAAYLPAGGTGQVAILTLAAPPTANLAYTVKATGVSDLFANLSADTKPIALFSSSVLAVNASWRYNDSGIDPGAGWEATAFNDGAWALGTGVFDAKKDAGGAAGLSCRNMIAGVPVGTCINLSNAAHTAEIPSAYFRTHFSFSGNLTSAVICVRPIVDDGAIFFLNGVELGRIGMNAGTVAFATLANRTVGDAAFEGPFYFCPTNLVAGDNVLAASSHQVNLTGSDLTFGGEASILEITPPISLTIVHNVDGSVTLTWPAGTLISSTDVSVPRASWSTVVATSPHTIPAGSLGLHRFYAVRVP
jgi:hypothetical protein